MKYCSNSEFEGVLHLGAGHLNPFSFPLESPFILQITFNLCGVGNITAAHLV